MPGRKQPEESDNERKREYRQFERRARGTEASGDLVVDRGGDGRAEVENERQAWAESEASRRAQSGLPKQQAPGSDEPDGVDGR